MHSSSAVVTAAAAAAAAAAALSVSRPARFPPSQAQDERKDASHKFESQVSSIWDQIRHVENSLSQRLSLAETSQVATLQVRGAHWRCVPETGPVVALWACVCARVHK